MKKLKILFIRAMPDYSINGIVLPPLGLLYLSSNLEYQYLYEKKLFDTAWLKNNNELEKELQIQLKEFEPDIIAVSALTPAHNMMNKICNLTKKYNNNIITIIGGPHISVYGKALKTKYIDFLIKGEAEKSFSKLCLSIVNENIDHNIPGLIYEENNEIFENDQDIFILDLDSINFPDWDIVDLKKYNKFNGFSFIYKKKPIVPFITSRACPFNCIYCHRLFGQKFKQRSIDNIVKEIELLYFKYGVREIQIVDDAFNLDINNAKKIIKKILSLKIDIAIAFPNGLIPIVDNEFLELLKKAGTYYISYAPESANSRIRKYIKKCTSLEYVTDAIEKTVKAGIFTNGYFMIGFPTETKEEIEQTIEYALNSKLHTAAFFTVVPFPNTELAEIAGISKEKMMNLHYFNETSFSENINSKELLILKKLAYQKFYFNIIRAIRVLRVIPKKYLIGSGVWDILVNIFQKLFLGHS